ncbi:MAG: HD domain-containing protein [Nitrospiraceae bacterium]|nr:HD domain-containing protein [Nitrospiraceae bacterium]
MVLKTKLIGIIVLVILLSVGLSTAVVLNFQSKRLIQDEFTDMELMGNIIIRSTESAMSQGKTDEVQKILENIGKDPEIIALRIVSPDGYILNSKDSSEIGYKSKDFAYSSSKDSQRPFIKDNSITHFAPLYNKPQCYSCHSQNIKINGIVELKYDSSRTMADIMLMKRFLVLSNILTVLVVAILLSTLFTRHIMAPLKTLLATIKKVENGDMDARVELQTGDELGTIAESFNRMIDEVKKLYEKNLKKEKEINRARIELEHKTTLEELNSQLEFKVKEVETANKAILSLTRELKTKNYELEKMVERLKKINDVGRVLSSIIETEELIKLIIRTTAELLKVEKGSIYLKKTDEARLTLQYQKGMGVENTADMSFEFHPLYKKLLTEGTSVFVKKSASEGGMFAIGVPLKVKGQIIGGMLLEKMDTNFTEDELEILSTLANQAMVAIENAWLYESVKSNYFGTIQALVNALEANDKYTRGHSERVKILSIELGKQLGLNYKELEILEHAAILHDIGKIGVDSIILNKTGRLTSSEFSMIKAHPLIGDEILGPIGTMEGVRTTIVQHHERYDGTGYPYGIAGEEISLKARILSVVDTFDAMMTDRPYRKALSFQKAKEEIQQGSGTQFDPLAVSAFLDLLDSREEDLLMLAGYVSTQ